MADSRVGHSRTGVLRDGIEGLQVLTKVALEHS